jgi:hypothetical protein
MMPVQRQEDYGERDADQSSLTHSQHEVLLHEKAQVGMKPQQALPEKLESVGDVSARPTMLPLRKQHGDTQSDKVGRRCVGTIRTERQDRDTVICVLQ